MSSFIITIFVVICQVKMMLSFQRKYLLKIHNKHLIIMSISVIVIIMEHEVSGCLPSFRGFWLIEGRNAYEEKSLYN